MFLSLFFVHLSNFSEKFVLEQLYCKFVFKTNRKEWFYINSQENITEIIINTINSIFSNLFSSIDNNIYSVLDEVTFIDTNIINNFIINKLLGNNLSNSLLAITNALLIGFAIYYCAKLLYSHFSYTEIEIPYQFVFKLLIFAICINSSYFICEQILNINYLISGSIQEIGKDIFNTNISFDSLIQNLNSIINIEGNSFNIFSVDGIIKGFISFGLFNLTFSYSLRYIMVKVFILISPFAFLTLTSHSTSWFFKSWIRNFIGLLLLQSLVSLILLVIFSINFNSSNLLSKFLYIGGIYALTRANNYIRELIGGISTDVSNAFNDIKGILHK